MVTHAQYERRRIGAFVFAFQQDEAQEIDGRRVVSFQEADAFLKTLERLI